jgi:hypothetical protein
LPQHIPHGLFFIFREVRQFEQALTRANEFVYAFTDAWHEGELPAVLGFKQTIASKEQNGILGMSSDEIATLIRFKPRIRDLVQCGSTEGTLTNESVEQVHRRNGLEAGLFEKVSASHSLCKDT